MACPDIDCTTTSHAPSCKTHRAMPPGLPDLRVRLTDTEYAIIRENYATGASVDGDLKDALVYLSGVTGSMVVADEALDKAGSGLSLVNGDALRWLDCARRIIARQIAKER